MKLKPEEVFAKHKGTGITLQSLSVPHFDVKLDCVIYLDLVVSLKTSCHQIILSLSSHCEVKRIADLFKLIMNPKQTPFNFYTDNGGSIVAIAGDDFAVIGSDTRLSNNYSIYTREQSKLFKLSDTTVLGCSGCWCDTLQLTKVVKAQMQIYYHDNNRVMQTPAVSQMLSTMLYYKRFMPYLVYNILAGLDGEGKGCVYSYDPIGHCERSLYRAGGSSGSLLQPLLDNQLGYFNMENVKKIPLTVEKALNIMKDVFIAAAERDIYTGDSIAICIIKKDGIKSEVFDLRKD